MTRLAMEANYQYVPLDPAVARMLATYVAPAPPTARLVDICAGTGEAAATLASAWAIDRNRVYLNELVDGRRDQCLQVSDHVLGADAIRTLQVSRHAFQVAWTNPPFGTQPREQGGGRYEPLFFKRVVEEGQWLQPGGLHAMLAPHDVWLTNRSALNHLARCYDQLTLLALPDAYRRYREVLVLGVVRSCWRAGDDIKAHAHTIATRLQGDLPILTMQAAPHYTIPAPARQLHPVVWRDASAATPEQAQADVLQTGGAWASKRYRARQHAARQDRRRIRPIFPLGKVAAALRVAEGDINNMQVTIADRPVRIKGSTRRTEKVWQEERTNSAGDTILDTHRMDLREPVVVTLDTETAAITRYLGDQGMAALMEHPDATSNLLAAVARSAPPVYAMHLPPAVDTLLTGIVPVSGRALPGYPPGFIPMQKHVIAALYTAFNEPDPHTGQRRTIVGLGADMGCGKAQPLTANVLTPSGWKRMGELQVGDPIIGADGRTHHVIGVYPQGETAIYRVTFSDRSTVECCADHLWRVQSANHRARGQEGVVMPLRDLMHDLRSPCGNNRWYVPMVQPVAYAASALPIDPYLLGLLIGDGSLGARSVGFTSADSELVQAVATAAGACGVAPWPTGTIGYRLTSGRRGRCNPLLNVLRTLGLAGRRAESKFIPHAYLYASVPDRIALLQGLLDSDGSVDHANHIEFSTVSPHLAADVCALVQSLGGVARRSERIPRYTHRGEVRFGQRSYRLAVALPAGIKPFRLTRKAVRYTHRPKYPPCRAMVRVEYVGHAPAQCIRVDAPDQLYVTDHYIVTHNSSMSAGAADVLRTLLPTHGPDRAYTVLVIAPNHLIGELAQVQAHDQTLAGRNQPPLPQWIGEWRDLLPQWHSTILETPAQVSAFYRSARRDPATPRVGFLAFSRFSLSSGWEVAVTTHRPAPPGVVTDATPSAGTDTDAETSAVSPPRAWRAAFYHRLEAEDLREWQALQQKQRARKPTERQAQRVASAQGATTTRTEFGPGESARTRRRDQIFRCGRAHREALQGHPYTPLWHYDGVFCPDCGRRVRTRDGQPHTHASLRKAGMIACPFCGSILGQHSRKQDNVGDRELPVWESPAWQVDATDAHGRRSIPWGDRPRSNPRIALGDFIVERGYARQTDLVITDEFHAMKGFASARGRIWGRLIAHAARTIGLTGSPYGGKASTAYWLLQRMGNVFVRQEFQWKEEKAFIERLGIIDTITSQVVERADAQALRGTTHQVTVRAEERNGLTAELAAIMQSQFIFILLSQMGFLLPPYHEGVVFFDLPADLAHAYATLVNQGKAIIKEPGGKDALSSYLQSTLTYALAPWQPVTIKSNQTGAAYRPPAWPSDTILPHHRWLARHAADQARTGRGMLVFAEHTNRLDILADLQCKIQDLAMAEHGTAVKVAILRSTTVKPGARGAWFAAREQDGTNVVLCHPGLVETGMNLIAWPEIVFAEPTYSLYRAMQARKRALRPTQTRPCNVTWLGYDGTMIAQALDIIGSKATAATLLNGDDLSSGLLQLDPGMSLLQELARRVLHDAETSSARSTIAARIEAAGATLKTTLEQGARDFVGVTVDTGIGPDPTLRPALPPTSGQTRPTQAPSSNGDHATAAGQRLTWGEVLVRRKGTPKDSPTADDEPQTIQLTFL